MKRFSTLLLTAALLTCLLLTLGVHADFVRSKTYSEGMFTDVPAAEWYHSSVQDAYEYGIMQGDSATTFNPGGTLTVAEGITISARIYETLSGTAIPAAEGEWYTPYVNYAIANGFLTADRFDNYDREIKRYEIAELLADVCGELPAMNTVESIPDVQNGASYAAKVLKLYKAGILTGNDDYGTFAPNSNLLRSEISAMAVRIADSNKRVQKTFAKLDARLYGDAYYIIEAVAPNGRNGLANGWNYDNRFDLFNTNGSDKTSLFDTDDSKFYSLIRDFKTESEGIFRLELMIDASANDNGVYIAFENAKEDKLFQLTSKNGVWNFVGTTQIATPVSIEQSKTQRYDIEMDFDLDNNTAAVTINNTPCGSISIPDEAISRLVIGTNKVGTGTVNFKYCRLSKNYSVNEHFLTGGEDKMGESPAGWEVTGDFGLQTIQSMRMLEFTSVKADSKAGTVSTATKTFTPVTGKVAFETMILLPEKTDGASVSLLSGGEPAVTFETRDGKIYVGDNMVNDYIANVWQTLHIEADTAAGTADILVNGKKKATVPLAVKTFDGINVTFAPTTDAVMWFDDVEVYNVIEHEDYPSYPQVAESTDYNIGLNVCWLWRDQQSGEGWDATSPFPEFDPYLGFYDEGLRETADWELKWMAEHGIDFIHACWYCPQGNIKAPIKEMRHSYAALHDGYMMAKYSDLVDFCIMWENNGQDCTSFEQFREYIWNYWVEYYFSDPRYARLDNKAVLTVWNRSKFQNAFGGVEGTKQAVEWMNEELKKLGYDGLILLASTQGANPAGTYTEISNLGYDATYGYHWGTKGYDAEYQIQCNASNLANSTSVGSFHIPTVSIGFNDVGRNETRDPIISKEDHLTVCQYIKKALSDMNTGTWKDNTLMVSTWNEYSEGTYVLPTASNGFDYLENIRLTFTNDTSDHSALDVKPTEAQIARVTHLYPPNHSPIRWFQFEKSDVATDDALAEDQLVAVRSYDMSTAEGTSAWKAQFGINDYSSKNGVISGTGAGEDYAICTDNMEPFAAADAPILHIRMKNDAKAKFEVFFTTSTDSAWNQKKYKSTEITKSGEFVDYYVNMASTGVWTDQISAIRIDPQNKPGTFEISLIEFMNYATVDENSTPGVKVNGNTLNFTFKPVELADGDYEVVGEARKMGFYSSLRLYHEWDRFTGDGVLTLKSWNEHTYVFTVGSDKVLVDGAEKALGYTFKLRDGLPVFHIKKLCDLIGYKYTMEGKVVSVKAATDEEYEIISNRVENQWEFDIPGETEGWRTQNSAQAIVDGYYVGTPTNGDPAMIQSVFFDASKYTHVIIGVVYDDTIMNTATPQLFFTTRTSTSFSADKCINGKYDTEGKKNGDIVEVAFDLTSNSLFNGVITGLRFDPFGGTNVFKVDYIRCINDTARLTAEDLMIEVDDANQWYFDKDGDLEGWRGQNVVGTATVANGYLKATGANTDPAVVRSVSFDANDYQYIVVGVRYRSTFDSASCTLFFVTEASPTWAADKGITGKCVIPAFTNVGDTVEVKFDMTSNSKWSGKVTAIRFDPFGAAEDFEIDYIRLYKKSGYVPKTPEEVKPPEQVKASKPTEAVITTAGELPEGVTVYSEPSTEISIVDDPENAGKKVYQAKCVKSGEQYTYLNVGMQFVAGATYRISYKIYPMKDMNGKDYSKTIIGGNFRFATTSVDAVKDHTFAADSDKSSGQGWVNVSVEYTVPEDYTAGDKDCFQIWGKPVDQTGICYLVSDIKIELKD